MARSDRFPKTTDTGSPKPGEPVFLSVGHLLRAHGLIGEMVLHIQTDFPERIKKGKTVYCGTEHQKLMITAVREHSRYVLVSFKGINSQETARKFTNKILYVKSNEIDPLPDGLFYHHELLGMDVFDEAGTKLGVLTEILETGANEVFLVSSPDGKEILIPAIENVLLGVQKEEKRINVHLPEWL